jgi:tricorn protease
MANHICVFSQLTSLKPSAMKQLIAFLLCCLPAGAAFTQIDAGYSGILMFQPHRLSLPMPTISGLCPKEGGTAVKLSSPSGVEIFPKFSP